MPRTATPDEVARYGHIAARLREFMERRGMSTPDLSQALGLPRTSTTAYHWVTCFGAPSPKLRMKLSKVTGIPEAELVQRQPGEPPPTSTALAVPELPRRAMVLQHRAAVLKDSWHF